MLKITTNSLSHNPLFFHEDNNYFNVIRINHLSKSLCNELNKFLLSKEIEFDNISTEEKKDDDKYSICGNFVINNLINILNKKDKILHYNSNNKNNKIQKKKIDDHNKNQLNTLFSSQNIRKNEIKTDKKEHGIFKNKLSTTQSIENKHLFSQNNELKNENIIKNLQWIQNSNQYSQKKINILSKNNLKSIEDNKKLSCFSHVKTNKPSFLFSKNINKINNLIRETDYIKFFNKERCLKSNIKPYFSYDVKNFFEWKKLINEKMLLLISNKEHQAEIHLKPEYLGPVHIKIQIKNDQATLNFTSYHNEIKIFLDNSVSFLRDSLKKNGIELKKVNIRSVVFSKDKKCKNDNNLFYKSIIHSNQIKKISQFNKKHIESIKYKTIDIYV